MIIGFESEVLYIGRATWVRNARFFSDSCNSALMIRLGFPNIFLPFFRFLFRVLFYSESCGVLARHFSFYSHDFLYFLAVFSKTISRMCFFLAFRSCHFF